MVEALDYYGSEKARIDLSIKESELRLGSNQRLRIHSAMDFVSPYQRTATMSMAERKNTINSRFGITNQTVREIGTQKQLNSEDIKRQKLLNKLGI